MTRRLLALVLLLLPQLGVVVVQRAPSGTQVTSWMVSGSAYTPTPNATIYEYLYGASNVAISTETSVQTPVPIPGVFKLMRYDFMGGLLDLGENFTGTLNVNGSATSPAISCTNTGTADATDVGCTDSDTTTVAAGDLVAWKIDIVGTPTNAEDGTLSIAFASTNNDESMFMGAGLLNSTSARYANALGAAFGGLTAADATTLIPDVFTASAFYVHSVGNMTANRTFYLCYDDNVTTDTECNSDGRVFLSCTISAGGATCNDTVCDDADDPSCITAAGNRFFMGASTGTNAENRIIAWGVGLTNSSQRFPLMNTTSSWSPSGERAAAVTSTSYVTATTVDTDTNAKIPAAATATQLYASSATVTSAGTLAVAIEVNGTPSATQTCNLTTGVSACNDTDDVSISALDILEINVTPTTSPASQRWHSAISMSDLEP